MKRLKKTNRSYKKNSKLCSCKISIKSQKTSKIRCKTNKNKLRNESRRQWKVTVTQQNFNRSKPTRLNFRKNLKLINFRSKRNSKPTRINSKKSLRLSRYSCSNNFIPIRLFYKKRLWLTSRSSKKSSQLSCSKIINRSSKTIRIKLSQIDRKIFQLAESRLNSKRSRLTNLNFKKSWKKNKLASS